MSKDTIIDLTKEIFNVEPDVRFAEQMKVPKGLWNEIWRRYKWLEYTPADAREYYFIKTKRRIGAKTFYRWVKRTEAYFAAQPLIKKKYDSINSVFFGEDLANFLVPKEKHGTTND